VDELKPCPFCGENEMIEITNGWSSEEYTVWCKNCGVIGPNHIDKDQTIVNWNLRRDEESLREIIQDYRDDISRVLNEQCPTDEKHCGCVPILRKSNRCYRNALVLITTLNELPEIITVANRALNENFTDYSMAKACGEYWSDKYGILQDDYADVCQKRLDAAESFSKRIVELESELAALKEALDISHKNHDRCNRDYVLLKKHLDGINRAVDVLCPKVARAITKLTPPSIADAYRADHQFARELRAALNDVTDAQNTVYKPEAE